MRNINGLGCPVFISNAHYNNKITYIYSRANKISGRDENQMLSGMVARRLGSGGLRAGQRNGAGRPSQAA